MHGGRTMKQYNEAFIGIDTAKNKHAVAIADAGREGEIRYLGEIDSAPATVERIIRKLADCYKRLHFCYEAAPTGYGLYRQVRALGHDCIGLCQLSRLLIDHLSVILPRAQAVSRMPSAIAVLRMCCQRRVAAGTCWRMRDRQRRKFRSSSWPRQYRLADPVLFNPSLGRHQPLMPR